MWTFLNAKMHFFNSNTTISPAYTASQQKMQVRAKRQPFDLFCSNIYHGIVRLARKKGWRSWLLAPPTKYTGQATARTNSFTVDLVQFAHINPTMNPARVHIPMFSFSLIERRHVGGESFPLRADIRSNEHRLFAKQKDEEFTKLVFVELSTLQRTKDAVVVTHLTASVQAQSVVEPRVVLVDLLCLGKKVVCVKIYRVIYISNQNI